MNTFCTPIGTRSCPQSSYVACRFRPCAVCECQLLAASRDNSVQPLHPSYTIVIEDAMRCVIVALPHSVNQICLHIHVYTLPDILKMGSTLGCTEQ